MEELSSSIDQEDTESDLMLHFLEFLKEQKQIVATKVVEDISTVQHRDTRDTEESEGHEVLRSRENNNVRDKKMDAVKKPLDRLGVLFNCLCKYARYSKFEVRGILRNGDFSSMGNVICSLGFDPDEDYIATAGVSKKIKVYDFNALLNDSVDIHYPAIEMSNKTKLSWICWNSYMRNYLASTDYDGVVKIRPLMILHIYSVNGMSDSYAGTGEVISHHIEHEKRAWSVDFSRVDPMKLASESDDCSVKLWSMNEAIFPFK
ncbi:SPA1-related 2-like protein isoform X1 [Tanacetum coccineum]